MISPTVVTEGQPGGHTPSAAPQARTVEPAVMVFDEGLTACRPALLSPTAALSAQVILYRHLRFNLIPAKPDGSKRPAIRSWAPYQQRPASAEQIADWFRRRALDPAVILGPISDGLVCRDFDTGDAYEVWAADNPDLARTLPTVRTGRGYHVYFRSDWTGFRSYGSNGELRGDSGHYCLLPPSLHASGTHYQWLIPPSAQSLLWLPGDELHRYGFLVALPDPQEPQQPAKTATPLAPSYVNRADLSPQDARAVEDALEKTRAVVAGERHDQVFQFARKLRAIPALADKTAKQLEPFVHEWFRRSLPYIGTKDWLSTWIDFRQGWDLVRCPASEEFMQDIAERAKRRPFERYEDPETNVLAAVCRELQAACGSEPFYLSLRTAGGIVGKSHEWANGRLWLFQDDGLLRCVSKGSPRGRRASEFLWLGGDS